MSASAGRTVRVSGWGWEGVEAPAKLRKQVKATLTSSGLLRKGHAPLRTQHLAMPTSLPAPAFPLPSHLSPLASTEARDRLRCSRGMSSRDILRGVAAMGSSGTQDAPVDYVLCPRSEEDVLAALRFASCHDVAVIPRVRSVLYGVGSVGSPGGGAALWLAGWWDVSRGRVGADTWTPVQRLRVLGSAAHGEARQCGQNLHGRGGGGGHAGAGTRGCSASP